MLDIQISKATDGQLTEPESYASIFERGIDPDVDNPEKCHDHSKIPDEWPPVKDILRYQTAVRNRARALLQHSPTLTDRRVHEALWIGFEHEAMHLETFLYMLVQSDRILPPPLIATPNFEYLAMRCAQESVPNEWFSIPAQTVSIGLDDTDPSQVPVDSFGWDNEKPRRSVRVDSFEAQSRPITNGEFATYLEVNGLDTIPASWKEASQVNSKINGHTNGTANGTNDHGDNEARASSHFLSKYSVRTVFGPVPLRFALDWPVMASYDQLQGYASWKNCRIPTHEEVRSIYQYTWLLKNRGVENKSPSKDEDRYEVSEIKWCLMELILTRSSVDNNDIEPQIENTNGFMERRNGKPRAPDHQPVSKSSETQVPVYIDLDGYNVGFKHWHPTPVTQNGNRLSGQGDMGGVWEWTSTPLRAHEGFKAMDLYPAYTGLL